MIIISTALYCEASPIIKKYKLKKNINFSKFEIFENNEITLIITGTGKMKSAIGLTYLLTHMNDYKNRIFINIGVCGAKKNMDMGGLYLCNQIIENETQKSYYPDILFEHNFKESNITTFDFIVKKEQKNNVETCLVDMESSSLYQVASMYLESHKLFFFKIVSDYIDEESSNLTPEIISQLINMHLKKIMDFSCLADESIKSHSMFSKEEVKMIEELCLNFKLTQTMKNELFQLLTYYKASKNDITELIEKYKNKECLSKVERKKYFAEIKRKIL